VQADCCGVEAHVEEDCVWGVGGEVQVSGEGTGEGKEAGVDFVMSVPEWVGGCV